MWELFNMLTRIAPLSHPLLAHLRSIIIKKEFKKGTIIHSAGDICHSILFIQSGLVRSYTLLDKKEVSNWFMEEGNICISIHSFLQQVPASDTLVALEKCVCWSISHEELEKTYRIFPEFNLHGRLILSKYYVQSELRNLANKRRSPERKYEHFMKTEPWLALRVTNNHLASYLNVSERTYNIMRKAYRAKKK